MTRAGLTLLVLVLAAGSAGGQAGRDYPPYPEVWGRELPAPAGRIVNGFSVRDFGNGDMLLSYAHYAVDPQTGNLRGEGAWAQLEFFAGNRRSITPEAAQEVARRYALPRLRVRARSAGAVVLANGHKVVPTGDEPMAFGCGVNYAGHLVAMDRGDRVVARKMVLRLLDRPERREYWAQCEHDTSSDHYLAKVDALALVLYPLADGTFLGEGTQSPFMIRFRADLTSPFIDAHPNLFLVDQAEVDGVVRRAYQSEGRRIQLANDALYGFVMELKRKKEK